MATKEQLLDPEYVPYEGELRYVNINGHFELQQYQARTGWTPVQTVTQQALREARRL